MGRIVLGEGRIAHAGSGDQDTVRVREVVGGSSRFFVPSGSEFVAESHLEGQIRTQFDGVFEIGGAEKTSPSQFIRIWHNLKRGHRALQEGLQAGEAGLPELAGGGILIVLHALEPDSRADLVTSFGDLHAIGVSEQISAVPNVGGVVRPGRGDGSARGSGDAAANHDASGAQASDEVSAGGKRS